MGSVCPGICKYDTARTTQNLPQEYRYTQREEDPESALMHYRARSYDPRTGRFLQRDPLIAEPRELKDFTYATNLPTKHVDPLGLFALTARVFRVKDTSGFVSDTALDKAKRLLARFDITLTVTKWSGELPSKVVAERRFLCFTCSSYEVDFSSIDTKEEIVLLSALARSLAGSQDGTELRIFHSNKQTYEPRFAAFYLSDSAWWAGDDAAIVLPQTTIDTLSSDGVGALLSHEILHTFGARDISREEAARRGLPSTSIMVSPAQLDQAPGKWTLDQENATTIKNKNGLNIDLNDRKLVDPN